MTVLRMTVLLTLERGVAVIVAACVLYELLCF